MSPVIYRLGLVCGNGCHEMQASERDIKEKMTGWVQRGSLWKKYFLCLCKNSS